jgi:hypothetical protein
VHRRNDATATDLVMQVYRCWLNAISEGSLVGAREMSHSIPRAFVSGMAGWCVQRPGVRLR